MASDLYCAECDCCFTSSDPNEDLCFECKAHAPGFREAIEEAEHCPELFDPMQYEK